MQFRDHAIIRLEVVDSTNNYAANMVRLSAPPEGTVITALEQTAGRGQRGAAWESTPGENLLMSLILYPSFLRPSDAFVLSKCISLAIAEYVGDTLNMDTFVKWPNDIYVRDRKIAGILIETAWNEGRLQYAIAGIGLNVNQLDFSIPHAASLRSLDRQFRSVDLVCEQLTACIAKWYTRLQSGSYTETDRQYQAQLYRKDQWCEFTIHGTVSRNRIRGVDHEGKLRLESEDGQIRTFDLKEVAMIV